MKVLYIFIVSSFLFCACNLNKETFNLVEFDSKRSNWEALGINSYRFTAKSELNYARMFPVTVTVIPGFEPELTYDREEVENNIDKYQEHLSLLSQGYTFPPFFGSTIDEIFASMRSNLLEYHMTNSIVKIHYNKDYHYPEKYFTNEEGSKGGDVGFIVSYFEVLENNIAK